MSTEKKRKSPSSEKTNGKKHKTEKEAKEMKKLYQPVIIHQEREDSDERYQQFGVYSDPVKAWKVLLEKFHARVKEDWCSYDKTNEKEVNQIMDSDKSAREKVQDLVTLVDDWIDSRTDSPNAMVME